MSQYRAFLLKNLSTSSLITNWLYFIDFRWNLLGNRTIEFNTRGKKSEPGLRKQLNTDIKSTTKLNFFYKYMNIFIYFTDIRRFRFSILYFKYLQTLILCVTMFYKTAFYYLPPGSPEGDHNLHRVRVSRSFL